MWNHVLRLFTDIFGSVGKMAPSLANEITLTGGAGAHEQGSWTTILSAADMYTLLGSDTGYRVHFIVIHAVTGLHQIELGYGEAGSEVSIGSVSVAAVGQYAVVAARVPAAGSASLNTRLAARTASKAGTGQTCTVKACVAKAIIHLSN